MSHIFGSGLARGDVCVCIACVRSRFALVLGALVCVASVCVSKLYRSYCVSIV